MAPPLPLAKEMDPAVVRETELPPARLVGVLAASVCVSPAALVIVAVTVRMILSVPGVPAGNVTVPPELGSESWPPTALRLRFTGAGAARLMISTPGINSSLEERLGLL